jgi:hypothetical protein
MSLPPDREEAALAELEKIVQGDKLAEVFDMLEPRAGKLAKQPSSVSFIILFGALLGLLGIVLGFFAEASYGFPWLLVVLCTAFLIAGGMALGNLVSIGRRGLSLEKKGRAIAAFLEPITPILSRTRQTAALREVSKQLGEGVQTQLERELGPVESKPERALISDSS